MSRRTTMIASSTSGSASILGDNSRRTKNETGGRFPEASSIRWTPKLPIGIRTQTNSVPCSPTENIGMPHQSSEPGDVINRLSKACSETWRSVTLWLPLRWSISAAWRTLINSFDRSARRDRDSAVNRPACYNSSIEVHRILNRLKNEERAD